MLNEVFLSTVFSFFPKKHTSITNLIAKSKLEKIKFKSHGFFVNDRIWESCTSRICYDCSCRKSCSNWSYSISNWRMMYYLQITYKETIQLISMNVKKMISNLMVVKNTGIESTAKSQEFM